MFSATKGSGTRRLVVETFTTNTSWTAPSSVRLLQTLVGEGTDGTPGDWTGFYDPLHYIQQTPVGSSSDTLDWGSLYSSSEAAIDALNSGGAFTRTIPNDIPYVFHFVNSSDEYIPGADYTGIYNGRLVRGVAALGVAGSPLTSGQVLYSELSAGGFTGWYVAGSMEIYENGTNGLASTGFGYVFPGGDEGPAVPVTYNNVAVTPNTVYPLVVPSGGSITISYFV